MTAIINMLSERNRTQLLARLGELQAIDHAIRQPGQTRPPDPPPPLAAIAASDTPRTE
jgi:hypothetical protein